MAESFDEFRDRCLEDVSALQQEFERVYALESYEQWSFDDDFGVFRFESDHGRNLYFRYSLVGSFSDKTSTWRWSWDNEHLIESERRGIGRVRAFGGEREFADLTRGLIDADEYTGWEMTAISARVLNALGVYRFTEDHLTFYVVFTGELTKEEYNALKERAVECDVHGFSRAAFVCQHLNKDTRTGFHEPFESDPLTEPEGDYQGWCDECETVRLREGEWNDVSEGFARIRLICGQCFFEIKGRNAPPLNN